MKISSCVEVKDVLIKAVNINIEENGLRYEGSFIVSKIFFDKHFDYITIMSNNYKNVDAVDKFFILKQKINKIKQHIGGI